MSTTIENQIVKMQFDNKGFEQGAQQSMSTLDKLKKMLHFDKVDMSPLQKAFTETEATATKAGFHIRDIWLKVATTLENQIADKIVDTGKKIFSALSLEGVTDGFKEYELKMGSIQTIMAGTGESLATVNRYLDELNTYSDKTIYSFSDMTQSIGKFTNAGVKLNDAVNAIKGIANEAAVSGANSNEASRAMYNFAQALSAGFVKLIDWKSIENANMATQEFKQTLIDVALGLGTVVKVGNDYQTTTKNIQGKTSDLFNATMGFNDSLNHQWMSTQVLTNALEIYATDVRELTESELANYEKHLKEDLHLNAEQVEAFEKLGIKAADAATEIKTFTMLIDTLKEAIGSGWAMTWQYFIGDFEQAKALWTDVGNVLGDVINKMSDARNSLVKASMQTGWERFTTMTDRAIPESEKFREVLLDVAETQGVLTHKQALEITSTEKLMKSFHELRWATGDLLRESVTKYTETLESMSKEEREAAGISEDMMDQMRRFNDYMVLDGRLGGKMFNEMADAMNNLGGRENIIQGLKNVFDSLKNTLTPIGEAFDKVFGVMDPKKIFNLTVRFREFTEQMKVSDDAANTIRTSFSLAFGGIKTILDAVSTAINGVLKLILPAFNLFDAIFGLIGKVVAALTGSHGALEAADKFTKIGDSIGDKYLGLMQKLADFINKVADAIRGIPEATIFVRIRKGVLSAIQSVKSFWKAFVELPVIQQMINDFNTSIETIQKTLEPVVQYVESAFDSMKRSVSNFFTWESLNKNLTTIYDAVKKVIDTVKGFATRVKLFFTNLKSGKSVVDSFKASFGDIIDKMKELKKNVLDFFDKVFSKSEGVTDKFNLDGIAQSIHDFVTNITPDQITMIAVAGSFMLIALNLLKLSNAMRNAVEAFTGIGTALKNVINSYVKKQKSAILQVAEAIVIVAAAFWVLSTIPTNKMENAKTAIITITACLGALTLALMGVGLALGKKGGPLALVQLASGLAAVAGSFVVAVAALKMLEFVSLDMAMIGKIAMVGIVMTMMIGMTYMLSKLDKFNKGSLTLVAAAGALFLAASALAVIGQIPSGQLDKAMATIGKLMIGLGLMAVGISKLGAFSVVGLIAIVLTFEKLIPSIEDMVTYDYSKINEGLAQNELMLRKLGGLLLIMTGIGALAGNRIKGAGIAFLAMSATFAILVGVAKLSSMLKPSELAQGEQFIMKMAGIMALLEICSKKSKLGMYGGKDSEGSKVFIRLAETMAILLGITKLASMMTPGALVKGELAVAGLIALTAGLIWVAKQAKESSGVLGSISKMLIAITFVLGMVAVLAVIPIKKMAPALGAVLAVMTALGFLAYAMAKNNTVYDKAKQKATNAWPVVASAAILAVCGALIYNLANQAPKNIMAAAGSLAGVALAMAALAAVIGRIQPTMANINWNQVASVGAAGLMILWISHVLTILASAMQENNIGYKQLVSAAAAIAAVLVGITPALYIIGKMEDPKIGGGTVAMVASALGAMTVIAGAIWGLSNFGGDSKKMVASAIAISIAMIAVCAPIAVLGYVGNMIGENKVTGLDRVIVGALGVLIGVAGAIFVLSKWGGDTSSLIASAQALSIALIAICIPIAVLGAVGELCKTANPTTMFAAMGSALGALAGIAIILGLFASLVDIDRLVQLNDAIPVLITVMTGVAALAVALGFAGTMAAVVPGSIGAAFGILAAALVAFAGIVAEIIALGALLNNAQWAADGLDKGLDAIILIFSKLGAAVGAAVNSFGMAATSGLETIGDRLTKFSEQMIPFTENMAKVSKEAVTGCINLAEAMAALTAANFLELVGKVFGFGSMDFAFFTGIGDAVAAFADSVKDISPDALTKASLCSSIAKKLAEVNGFLENEGGLAGAIFGEKDLSGFGAGIMTFGLGIKGFAEAVSGLDESAISSAQNAADAAGPIITMTKSLVSHGGWLQKIMGEQDLKEFGTSITAFATALMTFVAQLKLLEGVSPTYPEMINRCAEATKPLVDLAAGLENSGGKLAKWIGDNTLSRFGETLVPFVKSLYAFALVLKQMAEDVPNYKYLIINTADAVTHLSDLANGLGNMKGVGSWFKGDNRLDTFGDTLKDFGKGLKKFTDSIKDIDTSKIPSIIETTESLIALALDASAVPVNSMLGLRKALSDLSYMPIHTINMNWKKGQTTLTDQLKTILDACKNIVVNRKTQDVQPYNDYGAMVPVSLGEGIKKHQGEVTGALGELITAIKNYLSQNMKTTSFETYGANVAIGLKNGIDAHSEEVVTSAKNMAEAVNKAVPKQLQEKSPSRLSYKYGKNYDLGMANGIDDYTSTVVGSATNMSQAMVQTANNIISSISAVIDSDMDSQPTIRPVLDTSGVEKGVKGMNRLFNNSDLSLVYSANRGVNKINAEKNSTVSSTTGNSSDQVVTQQINYTQNNYSPKALSTIEIYRQTKNQIGMMKGATANA